MTHTQLIIITGYPSSGKTFRARQLEAAFQARIDAEEDPTRRGQSERQAAQRQRQRQRLTVVHLESYHSASTSSRPATATTTATTTTTTTPDIARDGDDGDNSSFPSSLPPFSSSSFPNPTRTDIYSNPSLEKTARAAELSAVKKALSKDTVVIADGLNYIKGFRYQLWCEAKAVGTKCCTVHVAAGEGEVRRWNLRRGGRGDGNGNGNGNGDGDGDGEDEVLLLGNTGGGEGEEEEACLPESHTALFGDRLPLDVSARSRSSSLGAHDDDDNNNDDGGGGHAGGAVPRPTTLIEETLKSFRLSGPSTVPDEDEESSTSKTTTIQPTSQPNPTTTTTATAEPSSSANTDPASAHNFPEPTPHPYSSKTLQSLLMRYEPPSPFSKWDKPLFTVPACDPYPPTAAIWDALSPPEAASQTTATTAKKGSMGASSSSPSALAAAAAAAAVEVKPHTATVLPRATATDALQVLERTTSDVVAQIMAQVQQGSDMDVLNINITITSDVTSQDACTNTDTTTTLSIPTGTTPSLPMLQRLRRRFTQIQRGSLSHGQGHVTGPKAVAEAFVRFLSTEMERGA